MKKDTGNLEWDMGPWSRNGLSLCYLCFIKFRGCVFTFQRLWNPNSSSGRHIEVQHWEARNFPFKMYPRGLTAWFYPWTVIIPKKVFHSNHHFSGMKKNLAVQLWCFMCDSWLHFNMTSVEFFPIPCVGKGVHPIQNSCKPRSLSRWELRGAGTAVLDRLKSLKSKRQ